MEIYANGIDLTASFRNESAEFPPVEQANLILTRENKTLKVFFTATGMLFSLLNKLITVLLRNYGQ